MQQVIIDFGRISIFGHPLGLSICESLLTFIFGFTLGVLFLRWLIHTGQDENGVVVPLIWLVVVGLVVFKLRPITLSFYVCALTAVSGFIVGLLLGHWRVMRWSKVPDAAVSIVVLVATVGYLAYGRSIAPRIYGYGLMLVLGFICATYLARRRAKRFGESPDVIVTLGLLSLVGGIIGARLAFVIEKWDEQFAGRAGRFGEILNVTSGGLIYFGGVVLAVALVLVYLRVKRLPIRRYLDILAPVVMLGLAFGRMGCTLNGCCYGGRCRADYSLAMRFPYASRPLLLLDKGANDFGAASVSPVFFHQVAVGPERSGLAVEDLPGWLFVRDSTGLPLRNIRGGPILKSPSELTFEQARQAGELRSLPVQPAQVFGVVNAFVITGLLLCFSRLRRREGQVFALMLILYPITRFALEGIRGDNPHNLLRLELTHNQYTSIGMMVVGLVLFFALRYFQASAGPFWQERAPATEPVRRPGRTKQRERKR